MKRYLRAALGLALAGFFLWLVLRQVDAKAISQALVDVDGRMVALTIPVFFAGYACRVVRWRLMLVLDNPRLTWLDCAGPLLASVAANNVLPFRAGDVLRAFGFNRQLGVSAATSITTLVAERLLDMLMVLLALGVCLAALGERAAQALNIGGLLLIGLALVILILLYWPRLLGRLLALVGRGAQCLHAGFGQAVARQLAQVDGALNHLANRATMLRLVAWSAAAWLCEGIVFWLAALALPGLAVPSGAWLALPVGTLSTIIPSTPGYVGTFDYFTAKAMLVIGNDAPSAAAYALLVHLVLWLPVTLAGGAYLWLRPPYREGT